MNPAIRTENLTFAYKDSPFGGVSLSVEKGEMVGILGPQRQAKRPLLKIFSAVLRGGERSKSMAEVLNYGKRELSRLLLWCRKRAKSFPYTVAEIVLMGRASYHSPLALEERKISRSRAPAWS
jgi:ABC-type cobalamin/Fe3+-siderophores transport system ATPase subunit